MKTEPIAPRQITLAVLAGGEGSRMGRPKGALMLNGKPILHDLLDRFAWPGPVWLITAPGREHPPGWERFDREFIDPTAGGGPLRGVLTVMENLRTPLAAIVTVDMPGVGREQIEWLVSQLGDRKAAGIMCRRPVEGRTIEGLTMIEPFPLILRAEAIDRVRNRLAQGRRSVHGLLEEPDIVEATAPTHWSPSAWINLNEPGDLNQFNRPGEP